MQENVHAIIEILKARYPDALCALHYQKDPPGSAPGRKTSRP